MVDLNRAGTALAMGFADEHDETGAEDLRYVSTELQPGAAIY